MEPLFLKMRCYAKVLVLILPCVAFWGCATLKGAADSTNTMIKELDTDLIVCQFKDCPGYDEYKKAKQLFQDSDYQGALVNIQISVSETPRGKPRGIFSAA